MDLREKALKLPEVPGVYLMKDSRENIIYVGKSKNLKNRVRQYFQSSRNHPPKIVKMVQGIRDFEYIITDTEFEALLLECRLIKDIQPMYNSQMKNDRGYVYIKITANEEFPRILISEDRGEDDSLYFGPYTSQRSIERAVEVIRENLQIRSCNSVNTPNGTMGCLRYQLGFCSGPCTDTAAKNTYMNQIEECISFFQGQSKCLISRLEDRMVDASQRLDFDKAARYRDDIYALNHIINKQSAISFTKRVRNIAVIQPLEGSLVKLLIIRDNELLHSEKIECNNMEKDKIKEHIKASIFRYLNTNKLSGKIIIDKQDIDQAQIIFSYLKNKKNNSSYLLIPTTWLKGSQGEKLDVGIDKLLGSLSRP